MRITINTRKTIEQNAAEYFERAKKAKKKLEGAKKALSIAQLRIAAHGETTREQDAARVDAADKKLRASQEKRKLEWYEKLRWFYSSDGFLCVGGRDTSTNEIVVKRYAQPGDLVFHTDMAGAPFVLIKAEGKEIPVSTMEEAAQFCACFSRAWKNGMSYLEVFCVAPEQLSKEPNSGEFLPKGAFVVRGSVKYFKPKIELVIGRDARGRVIAGAASAVQKHSVSAMYSVMQGNEKSSDVAKRLSSLLDVSVDEVIPMLPSGGVKMGKEFKRERTFAD